MGLLEDLSSAIDAYPGDNITIQITDFNEPGGHINVGEIADFRVRVTNNGHLDMRDLRLHIIGSQWASVGLNPLAFSNSIITSGLDVNAHTGVYFGPFYMRADSATPGGGTSNEDLFSAHISTYNADLEHILMDHGHHASNPTQAYNRHIHPA